MCFRPADGGGGGPMKCPECGKPIQMMAGIVLNNCPFCKCDFTPYLNGEKPIPGMEGAAPGAPGAPAAPGAPGAPAAPGAPGAPKPPAAPGA
ncbi:MAG: hypothetical protein IKF56_04930 [Eggerthellaceae bacterium]|nr:hypothetical protein [Eggerthellaceae bacterium]